MKAQEYLELQLPVEGLDRDYLSAILFENGCMGIQELDDFRWAVFFTGDFAPGHLDKILQQLQTIHPQFNPEQCRITRIPVQDWNAEWKKHFKPFNVVPGICIRPPWESLPEGFSGTDVIIHPQMAFGTGHHESTRLVIQTLQNFPPAGKSVLDMGSGSGVLSIISEKLGASEILAIDNDPDAVENIHENIKLNHARHIEVKLGEIEAAAGRKFDYILSNINLETNLQLAYHYLTLLNPGGLLMLSGFLKKDVSQISYIYKQTGLQWIHQTEMGEWALLIWEYPA